MITAVSPAPTRLARADSPAQLRILYIVLGLLSALAIAYQVRFSFALYQDMTVQALEVRAPMRLVGYPPRIVSLEPEASAAGLRVGDVVVSTNGQEVVGTNTVVRILDHSSPGGLLDVSVARGETRQTFRVRLAKDNIQNNAFWRVSLDLILGILMPWFSILLGFYVALVRPRDPLAWIVLVLLLCFSQLVNSDNSEWGVWIRVPAEIYHSILFGLWPLAMFLFGLYFPQQSTFFRSRSALKWTVVGAGLVLSLTPAVISAGARESLRYFARFGPAMHTVEIPDFVLNMLLIGASLLMLGQKASQAQESDARRRMRLLISGMVTSLAPILILLSLSLILRERPESVPAFFFIAALLGLLLFPSTLAYVIVVDRAMDVRFVIRQGLQYAFARNGVLVLRLFTLALFATAGYLFSRKFGAHSSGLVLMCAVLFGGALFVNAKMKKLATWVDKRFFREAYDAEVVLTELSERVRGIRETQSLVETVSQRIANALHVGHISVLMHGAGRFEPCYSQGFDAPPRVAFPQDGGVAAYLTETHAPARVYFEDHQSWLYAERDGKPAVNGDERSALARLGAELLLPLSAGDRLLGFIAAGQKRSEQPYSRSDLRVLSSVAAQTGLALENAELTSAIATEMAQRERLAREVEIAREVQERLFPQILPPVEGLDYFGLCRTALGVGGDYYDFLKLPDGRFGIAVGDVAGKGIAAALLMASLQAILRGETARFPDDLGAMIGNLSRRVFEASSTNRYATFFYARYSPLTRILDYVNAGHNPPMLVRRRDGSWTTTLLEASGTVVGLIPGSVYGQASIQLESGDCLVCFTDGVSEAMNSREDEWGEARLEQTIWACANARCRASETAQRILHSADEFVAGARQHDDMTLVVINVL